MTAEFVCDKTVAAMMHMKKEISCELCAKNGTKVSIWEFMEVSPVAREIGVAAGYESGWPIRNLRGNSLSLYTPWKP